MMSDRRHGSNSNKDLIQKISHSIYVTNFPDTVNSRDLWKACSVYDTVVDVFIPFKLSKAGKRFAFVRFIKVRFDRPQKPSFPPLNGTAKATVHANSKQGFNKFNGQVITKENMMKHNGVNSWFHVIKEVAHDFVSDERIVWVDIEGVSLYAWSRETFARIESFKIIVKGKVFMVRAKELFTWTPNFLVPKEKLYNSDDESVHEGNCNEVQPHLSEVGVEEKVDSDDEGVADTVFEVNSPSPKNFSGDIEGGAANNMDKECSPKINAKVMNSPQLVQEKNSCESVGQCDANYGGSVLEVLEEVIRVGHAMSYTMVGCEKDIDDSLGNSGGILCIWESTVFKKDNVTISDSFVAIYGTWLSSNSKILFVVIYAPQQVSYKRILWEYISSLIGRWNGDAILIGDFNEGYTFTWLHPSATKMSKLDRFLVTDGILLLFPSITGICLDRHLSDHRPILLREVKVDFGPIPDGMIRFKKKLHELKRIIRLWTNEKRSRMSGSKMNISNELRGIDKELDQGVVTDTILLKRHELIRQLNDIKAMEAIDSLRKSKVRWAIEGDDNSKYFHGIINKKRSQLAVRGVFVDGIWCNEPNSVKEAFFKHYQDRFIKPFNSGIKINFPFPKRLSLDQVADLERSVLRDEIRMAVWNCGGCNSSFIALIPKVMDAKYVNDYRPISLIGSVYKVVTKIMANRLAMVIADIVFDSQSAFVAERQILDGPFILNEVLHWCKRKNKKAMFFKVDFAKAYDSVRWDYLIDVLEAFGFGPTWCKWIRGDPLSPYLFILVMESLNLSLCKAVDEGLFQECMSRHKAWVDVVLKLRSRLSMWKAKTLSIGGRLTLLKSVLGASPLYTMPIFKVPRGVLKEMESIRNSFFLGADPS
nr:RNA-directed DNA polymerase, eukaryota [Tanacetum cinerariifolium]